MGLLFHKLGLIFTSFQVQEVVLLDGDARHSESADKTTNKR
jgi:hypothetical protein